MTTESMSVLHRIPCLILSILLKWKYDDDTRSRNPYAQMMSPEEIMNVLDLVTTNGAVTMNIINHYGIEGK